MPNSWQQTLQDIANSLDHAFIGGLVLFVTAMMCMLIIGNPMIAWLQKKRWKKDATNEETWAVREDTPDTHQAKQGTPSMGGIGIIASTLLACIAVLSSFLLFITVVFKEPIRASDITEIFSPRFFLLPLVLLTHGLLGFFDDWSKASGRGGLKARHKLFVQIILALVFCSFVALPSFASRPADFLYMVLTTAVLMFALVATCNAANLTDGIDGLAAGLAVQAGIFLFFVTDLTRSNNAIAAFVCITLAGACFGFLFFNRYPARVFMGDTGSLAVGAALGAGAILQGAVWLLPFIGFIYFVEMFSVIFQVAWFKWTKRKTGEGQRLFRRAPLHHHFELAGWSEWRVVGTFWAINLFTSAIGLWLWHAGVLPRWP